jgi:arylsulfatase A
MEKPNIIYIMADDLGIGDLGCYAITKKIDTPNCDQIASEGVMFTDAHSSSAVCTPSRYSVVTGRYCWRTRHKKGVMWGYSPPLIEKDRMTIGSLLKRNGYHTAAIGKWHLGLGWNYKGKIPRGREQVEVDFSKPLTHCPLDLGFDYWFGIPGSLDMFPYTYLENRNTVGIPDHMKEVLYTQQRPGLTTDNWKDDEVDIKFVEKAKKFIETHNRKDPSQPFFLYLTPASPHRPCECSPEFVRGKSGAGPRGDMVMVFDWMVGEINDTLKKLGIVDNTLLIITSDNGAQGKCANGMDYGHKSNGIYRGQKADVYDGGHREPFIARWPRKIAPGSQCDEVICLGDMLATFASLVGEEIPENAGEDSFNVLPALLGDIYDDSLRPSIIHHSSRGMFAIRKGQWKLVDGLGSGGHTHPHFEKRWFWKPKGQLYNMDKDVREQNNVWKDNRNVTIGLMDELKLIKKRGKSRGL